MPRRTIDKDQLTAAVARGATTLELKREFSTSYAVIRRHLDELGLSLTNTKRFWELDIPEEVAEITALCSLHGETTYRRRKQRRTTFYCVKCSYERMVEHRKKVKQTLVAEHGGSCRKCGYDRSVVALEFHHVDPSTKEFSISAYTTRAALDKLRAEAAKCVLLCSNCHREIEAGLWSIEDLEGAG